jgi:hypothetical protein
VIEALERSLRTDSSPAPTVFIVTRCRMGRVPTSSRLNPTQIR